MSRNDLIKHCKRLIEEAYQEATEMIVAYLEKHPNETRKTLCREIDPDNFHALDLRVARLQEKRRSEGSSAASIGGRRPTWQVGDARRAIRNPEIPADIKAELVAEAMTDPDVRKSVEKRIASDPDSTRRVNRQAAALHAGGTHQQEPRPRLTPDYDQLVQDAVAAIISRLADRDAGRWNPSNRTLAFLHFLRRALDDQPIPAKAVNSLMDEITVYLEEAGR